MAFTIKQGNTRPTYVVNLLEKIGTPDEGPIPDLGAANSITFLMRKESAEPTEEPIASGVASLLDEPTAEVEYVWQAGDTDIADTYRVEFEIEWLPGAVETVPNDGYFSVVIKDNLRADTIV